MLINLRNFKEIARKTFTFTFLQNGNKLREDTVWGTTNFHENCN